MATVGLLIAGLTACASRVDTRGNEPDPDVIAQIRVGKSTRPDVAQLLGSPSSVSVFDGETWYYISERTEVSIFFEPEVTDRQVLFVRYDNQGLVADVGTLGLEDGKEIEMVERETPTLGNRVTFFDQLIGNLGRFNKDGQTAE